MEQAVAMGDNYQHEEQQFKSRFGQSYSPAVTTVSPEEEAKIIGEAKTLEKTYQSLEDSLKDSENEIKSIGLRNKSGVALMVYSTLDKLGLYPKERLFAGEIRKLDKQVNRLEKIKSQYERITDDARSKSVSSEDTKYKAELLIDKYDGVIEGLEKELEHLKADAREVKEKLRTGDQTPGLKDRFIGFKSELRNVKYDIRTFVRKRNRAAAQIVKANQKSNVYRMNTLKWENLSESITEQYDNLDILRASLENLMEISKQNKGISLLDAISELKKSEHVAVIGRDMVKETNDVEKRIVEVLGQPRPVASPISGVDVEAMEAVDHNRKSNTYIEAQKIMQRDEDSDLV